jgi:hypothetical protein
LGRTGGIRTDAQLSDMGFEIDETSLSYETCRDFVLAGFNRATLAAAFALYQIAEDLHPVTVRQLLYRAQAAGIYPDTSGKYYQQTQRLVLKLRREGIMPYGWVRDSTRRRLKPSSWANLQDYFETVRNAYRKDFWTKQPDYIEFFVEKDAMAGVLEPVTTEYDVYLSPIRGEVSETFAWEIAEEWNEIDKPIYAYYLGDHDPAGLNIEASLRNKLEGFCNKPILWQRLAVTMADFYRMNGEGDFELRGFPVKPEVRKKRHGKEYIAMYGDRCVEVDALHPDEIRQRIRATIESHIDQRAWKTH